LRAALDSSPLWGSARVEESYLQAINQVESWIESQSNLTQSTTESAQKSLADARQIELQDTETKADGWPKLRQGVSPNRRIAIEDPSMRHGRKSRSKRFDGSKCHILKDLD